MHICFCEQVNRHQVFERWNSCIFFLENQGVSPVPFQRNETLQSSSSFRVLKLNQVQQNGTTKPTAGALTQKSKGNSHFLSLLQAGGMNSAKHHMNLIRVLSFRHPPAMCFGGGKVLPDSGPAKVRAFQSGISVKGNWSFLIRWLMKRSTISQFWSLKGIL
jgi:hypothetical protein